MTTRVAIAGATGKLGRVFAQIVTESDDLTLHTALNSSSPWSDMDGADIVVDVTNPTVSPDIVAYAISIGARVLVGSSGWSASRIAALRSRVEEEDASVLIVPNFSVGSVLSTAFSAVAGAYFDSIEIIERHRQSKVDSPSGTAVRTAELIAEARSGIPPVAAPHVDQRARGEQVAGIPIHSLRMDGIVAQQEVVFGGAGEQLRISHDTSCSDAYAAGIALAFRELPNLSGLTVGLDSLLGIGHLTRQSRDSDE